MEKMKHQPIAITEHLFQLGTKSFPVYLSMGEEGMIIEGGTGPTAEIIARQIESMDIDPERISTIALTHTHADHVGAVPRLRRLWPRVKILAGPTASRFLKRDTFVREFLPADRMIGKILMERKDINEMPQKLDHYHFEADVVVEPGDRIDLGDGIVWSVFHTPGHSPCHISLFEEKEETLVIGDMTGYFDPDMDVFWPNYFHSLEAYCLSIEKAMALPAMRGLLSHNGVIEGHVREHFQKALKATEHYHREILGRLDCGEDPERICLDKAEWVVSLGALASCNVINALCRLLLKQSQRERGKELFSGLQVAAA
ncbi:MAG: MBL fold metallo-hydrolase [Deltaproteobacteria bacterium]|nr:MBL fold metallo-hydrolase [Deltaproteobacteria bacterium]